MVYLTGNIPVGDYDPDRLANLGLGHGAIDAGYGYTYFDPAARNEFSVVAGMTYNFENPDTDYQSGIDGHLDFGLSKFLSEQVQVGAVGYFYQQLTGDSGEGATLGAVQVARRRDRAAVRVFLPRRADAGLRQPQGLLRVRGREPAGGMERLADGCLHAADAGRLGGVTGILPQLCAICCRPVNVTFRPPFRSRMHRERY